MADEAPQTDLNPNGEAPAPGDMPQVAAIAQYTKDLSVENPSAPMVYQWQAQPQLDVQFNLNANQVGDDLHEVTLKIDLKAASEQGMHFIVDLTYAGLFAIRNVPAEALAPFVMIEAPRLLFPFARQAIAEAVTSMNFPPVLLDPIDFASAYMQQMQAQQGEQASGAPDATRDA